MVPCTSARSTLVMVGSVAIALVCCEPGNHWRNDLDGGTDADGNPISAEDADGDGISDQNEGRAASVDSDGDGVPDYLDADSDDDGIPDAIESGTSGDATRSPVDSDSDGTPDFRDLDSDANGVFDSVEGGADTDSDGIPDNADGDNDGDAISDIEEIGGNASHPVDFDEDGTPDYMDTDSDGDTIADRHDTSVDTDGDGEPDYHDLDSDNDGLSDADEVAAGTSTTNEDTDGDGVTDLVEVAAGSDALNPDDSPRTRGDFVFLVPYQDDPDPLQDTLSFSTDIQFADVYFLMDTTGSMSGAIGGLQTTLTGTIIPGIAGAISDVQFGVGQFRDYPWSPWGSGGDMPYQNLLYMTDSAADAQTAVNTMWAGGGNDWSESHVPALHAVATGCGDGTVADDPACADPALIGYPHFRSGAVPIVVLFSDATFHNGPGGYDAYSSMGATTPPTYDQAVAALNDIHARVIGVNSSGARANMEQLGRDTGTTDAAGTPFVYDQSGDFGNLVVNAVVSVAHGVPLDIAARAIDDPSDAVDAMIFIDRIIPATSAPEPCAAGLTVNEDTFVDVLPGTTVCFDIFPARNETVEPTSEPQIYMATVQVWGDDVTVLDERDVYFLIPPVIEGPEGPD